MKSKIIKFDYRDDVLFGICEQKVNDGDFIGAVRLYRDAISKKPWDYELNVRLADIYTGTHLNKYAINCWFRALASAKSIEEKARACNGLGATYYYLGKEDLAMHYFVTQLKMCILDFDLPYDDVISEINEGMIQKSEEPKFKIVDKQSELNEKCDLALRLLGIGDLAGAFEVIASLKDSVKQAGIDTETIHKLLTALVLADENALAREVAEGLYERNDKSFLVYFALCCANYKLGDTEKGDWAYSQLRKLKLDADGAFRMLALTLDAEKDEDALEYAQEVIKIEPENAIALYVCGLIYYNLGNYDSAIEYIKKAYYLTGNVVVEDMLEVINLPEEERPKRIPYRIDIDGEKIFVYEKKLKNQGDKERVSVEEIIENTNCLIGSGMFGLLGITIHLGLLSDYLKYEDYLKQTLINVEVPDEAKFHIVKEMIMCELFGAYSIVVGGMYREITIKQRKIAEQYMNDLFLEAYAVGAGALYVVDDSKVAKYEKKFKQVVEQLVTTDTEIDVSPNVFAGAVIYLCKIPFLASKDVVCRLFETNKESLNRVLKILNPKTGEK